MITRSCELCAHCVRGSEALPVRQVDLQYDLSFLTVAASLTGSSSRDEYYSRLQGLLCVPGRCSNLQVPSCYTFHGTSMTEHQKLQLDLYHVKPDPSMPAEVDFPALYSLLLLCPSNLPITCILLL